MPKGRILQNGHEVCRRPRSKDYPLAEVFSFQYVHEHNDSRKTWEQCGLSHLDPSCRTPKIESKPCICQLVSQGRSSRALSPENIIASSAPMVSSFALQGWMYSLTALDFLAWDVCTKPVNEAQRAEWKHLHRAGWHEWQEAAWHWSPSLHVCQKTMLWNTRQEEKAQGWSWCIPHRWLISAFLTLYCHEPQTGPNPTMYQLQALKASLIQHALEASNI